IAGRIALRSFRDTKARLLRIRWTMQVCTTVCGNTDVIASGKPLSPSTTAMRISLTPRALSSLTTLSQNLAPSVCSIQSPRTFVSWKDRKAILPAIKAISRAESADMALIRLEEFEAEWGKRYPAAPRGVVGCGHDAPCMITAGALPMCRGNAAGRARLRAVLA